MSNSISRRRFLGTTAAVGAAALLPAQPARAASGEISVWKFGGTPQEVEVWAARNDAFSAAQPDIDLNYSYFNGQIRRQKILAGFQTNRLADVIIAFGQDIPEFAGFGMIQPLDEIAPDRVQGWKDRIVPEVFESGMHDGKLYALPTYVDMASFLAINLDALEEAGFDRPPETWDELREYAKAMTKPDRPGIAFPATTAPVDINIFEGLAYANGGRIFDEDTGKVTLNDPGVVDALQFYVDLIKDGSTPAATSLTETFFRDTAQLFGQGRSAMWIGLSWLNTPWGVNENIRWTGVPMPKPEAPTGSYEPVNAIMDGTAMLMVSSRSKNPEAALEYVDFWSQDEQLETWGGQPEIARIPAGKAAWDNAELKEAWPNWVKAYDAGTLFEGGAPMPRFIGVSAIESALGTAIQQAVLGQKTPQEALDEATVAAQGQIDLIRG
ncbi:ABC transporter substrate-binding protein [Mameliella sediminis]|uniref:ABC transporter substrate-binding protein n=1 Tax=Mameliella sediminis TaxID=2836866 RepID=UPI001C44F790|nr:sugar ABC transporter substrate-binding protein [Mameliella sediminis]MBV7396860.1 sugar ABC transporter substrate-binding protein [Mameliella sediminis]MBY6116182.1 sugar ABC transporter substrate-binding protein [Antarctobacter heliothermus]MBY6146147.1 sugar ABC transporter substrate-binding protein [Mameliella alba]MCA0955332.1 sugar ABC transporter substrate-binding protein [Mameliella alba]